ncbi:acyclic terpene utilization AtuA family protein [Lewinella sp. W8]|nr:acyclic terpene utilization AtuA family protein [Lewinella sp. W8]MTB51400.1 acyclic terpene utilization AtuA family protein [Lewinella sp. W8]
MKNSIRIGGGAGYSGDRIEPARDLALRGKIDYLVFECLAERTIALAQLSKLQDPEGGYDALLEDRMRACLPTCQAKGIRVISNMGAANPLAAARRTLQIAEELGLGSIKVAAVGGDDVLEFLQRDNYAFLESDQTVDSIRSQMISANAYLGVEGIVDALHQGADVILTGRVADPALFLAPMIFEFGWSMNDYDLLGKGTTLGHLMECAGQVTGGYFADPGYKDVKDLARLGFPIAEITPDGSFFISKLPDTGGQVTIKSCVEQLLYEIHDPATYLTPDVVADFSKVHFEEVQKNKILVRGATGRAPTGQLKVSVGYQEGYIGEGQISYGGSGAMNRAQLALDIVRERLRMSGNSYTDCRFEIIGYNHLYGGALSSGEPAEVRIRVAAKTADRSSAKRVGWEVEALYTNGPAGGGGAIKTVQEVIAIQSVLLDANLVKPSVSIERGQNQTTSPEGHLIATTAKEDHPPLPNTSTISKVQPLIPSPHLTLKSLAHSRTGDKGNIANISVIAYDKTNFSLLERELTAEKVKDYLSEIVEGEVLRYALPQLGALNFVLYNALAGGVTRSLALDKHGKTLSSTLLDMKLNVND